MFRNPNIKSLGDILRRNAGKYPDEVGIVSGETRLTWNDLNKRVNRLANSLIARGVTRGGAVACLSRNRHELVETLLAANKIGSPYVPVNYRLAPDEVRYILEDVDARALIFDPAFTETVRPILPEIKGLNQVYCMKGGQADFHALEEMMGTQGEEEPLIEVAEDDLAIIAYTSGTTGFPKGVMGTHKNFLLSIKDVPFPYSLTFRANVIYFIPVFGAGAISSLYNSLYGAGKLVQLDYDPRAILETIEKEKIELMGCVPLMVMRMLNVPDADRYDLSSLKRIAFGAAPLSVPMLQKMRQLFPCAIHEFYAMCETMGVLGTVLYPEDLVTEGDPEKLGRVTSAGRSQNDVKVKVVRENDTEVDPGGEVGEVIINSYGNMKGYWKNPEATANALKDGWYYTGDLAWIDEEGYIFLVERRSDMIKSGGSNVYPAEVEKVLAEHPAVAEVAVIGTKDIEWGEAVSAVAALKPGETVTEEELIAFCKDKVAGYKKPKKVFFVREALPRNALGKVLRKDLRKRFEER